MMKNLQFCILLQYFTYTCADSFTLSEEYQSQTCLKDSDKMCNNNWLDSRQTKGIPKDTTEEPGVLTKSLFSHVPPSVNFGYQKQRSFPSQLAAHLCWKMPKGHQTQYLPLLVIDKSGITVIKTDMTGGQECLGVWTHKTGRMSGHYMLDLVEPHQKLNRWPGYETFVHKRRLANSFRAARTKFGPQAYDFMPMTYNWPEERELLQQEFKNGSLWITKPFLRSAGQGISVVDNIDKIPEKDKLIVQKYIENPHLINNTKYDLRMHFMITSVNPLRLYLHDNAIVRFATYEYDPGNLNNYIHLTNVALNEKNPDYVYREWTLDTLRKHFEKNNIDLDKIIDRIKDLIIKTVIASESEIFKHGFAFLPNNYMSYNFHGVDIVLDSDLNPWLLEINGATAIGSRSPKIVTFFERMVAEMLNMARFHIPPFNITKVEQQDILTKMNLTNVEQLTFDERLYDIKLSDEEMTKQYEMLTMYQEEKNYLEMILENLTPNDIRSLIRVEDELEQAEDFKLIFPTNETSKYLKYFNASRYNNLLTNAWEIKYGGERNKGRELLEGFCKDKIHLKVPDSEELDLLQVFTDGFNALASHEVGKKFAEKESMKF